MFYGFLMVVGSYGIGVDVGVDVGSERRGSVDWTIRYESWHEILEDK